MLEPTNPKRLPLWLKLGLTAFVAVLVPVYWAAYGPTNFLYYCDIALLMTVAAVWLESPLLASAPLVGIFLPQMFWVVDFIAQAIGMPITGMTAYMFDPALSLFTRFLSFFHFWLPFLLAAIVWRIGYDRRGIVLWTLIAWTLLPICYFLLPAPLAPEGNKNLPVNVNYVYGLSDKEPQTWLEPELYFGLLFVVMPLAIYLPTHVFFMCLAPRPERGRSEGVASSLN